MVILTVFLATACAGQELPQTASPAQVTTTYALRSHFELPAGSLAPQPGYELLRDLNDDPGHLIVHLARAAGVPAAERLFDALPNTLEGKLGDWMTSAISQDGLEDLHTVMTWSKTVLAQFEIDSELVVESVDDTGHGTGLHTLSSLQFDLGNEKISQPIPTLDSMPGAGQTSVELWVEHETDGSHLVFGEQRFGLLLGEAAFRAFEQQLEAHFGADLRGVLGANIDCGYAATTVAKQCVLGVCVGHQDDLLQLCDAALDELVDQIHDQFRSYDLEAMRLSSGEARITQSDSGTELEDGLWKAQAQLGQGLRELPASFESF